MGNDHREVENTLLLRLYSVEERQLPLRKSCTRLVPESPKLMRVSFTQSVFSPAYMWGERERFYLREIVNLKVITKNSMSVLQL